MTANEIKKLYHGKLKSQRDFSDANLDENRVKQEIEKIDESIQKATDTMEWHLEFSGNSPILAQKIKEHYESLGFFCFVEDKTHTFHINLIDNWFETIKKNEQEGKCDLFDQWESQLKAQNII